MRLILIEAYVQVLLDAIATSPIVGIFSVTLDKRTPQAGLVRGDVSFVDGSRLYFRELVEAQTDVIHRRMYSYHYQDANAVLIFRYDDTQHHPTLNTFPHHKHEGSENNVIAAQPATLVKVLREIEARCPLTQTK